jgi:hypothetical protein
VLYESEVYLSGVGTRSDSALGGFPLYIYNGKDIIDHKMHIIFIKIMCVCVCVKMNSSKVEPIRVSIIVG